MYWLHELSLSHFLTQITVAAAIRLHFNTFPPHIWAHFRGHFWANFWGTILSYIRAYFWANFQTRIFDQCRVEIFRLSDLGRTFYYDYLEILGSPENVLYGATRSSLHNHNHICVYRAHPLLLKITHFCPQFHNSCPKSQEEHCQCNSSTSPIWCKTCNKKSYIQKAEVLEVQTPQIILIFRKVIVLERENYQICSVEFCQEDQ